jgi:hypothetical protein
MILSSQISPRSLLKWWKTKEMDRKSRITYFCKARKLRKNKQREWKKKENKLLAK